MKITAVEVFAFKYDHHYRLTGRSEAPNRMPGTDYYFEAQWKHAYSRLTESCLVKVTTDEGFIGWGEAQAPLVPEVPATLIAKLLGPAILGMDPTQPERVYEKLYYLNHVRGHTASYTIDAIAGIDIALWDIKAQVAGLPLNLLLGDAPTERLPLYVSGLRKPDRAARQELAAELMREGFAGVKLFVGEAAEKAIEECEAIRHAIGEDRELAFDAICRYDFQTALAVGKGLDRVNAAWFEAPLDPEDVDGHARLAEAILTPLAVGEPLRTEREFSPWLSKQAMRIAQPDIVRCGITGGMRICEAAAKGGLRIGPHLGVCTSIGVSATWHVTSVLRDAIMQEHQYDMFVTSNKVLQEPLKVVNGQAVVPSGPGLGIKVDEKFVRTHASASWWVGE